MKNTIVVAGLGIVVAMSSSAALAQAKPDVLVKQRQAGMTMIGKYFGPLGGMAQGRVPYNAEVVVRNAGYLDVLGKLPWDGFDASTANEKSAALPAVFKDGAKFKQAADDMQGAIAKLVSTAKSGDEAAVKAAIGAVGKSCGGCHDNFREKK